MMLVNETASRLITYVWGTRSANHHVRFYEELLGVSLSSLMVAIEASDLTDGRYHSIRLEGNKGVSELTFFEVDFQEPGQEPCKVLDHVIVHMRNIEYFNALKRKLMHDNLVFIGALPSIILTGPAGLTFEVTLVAPDECDLLHSPVRARAKLRLWRDQKRSWARETRFR